MYHGFDIFDLVITHVRYFNRELNRKLPRIADKNYTDKLSPLINKSDDNNQRMIGSAVYSVFTRICQYLHCPEKANFPIFRTIIEIVLAGGLPVGWKGLYSGPTLEVESENYELKQGSFVVFWPYEEDPEFSNNVCEL